MTITGLRTSENFATNMKPGNFRDGLLRLYPNGKAPLTALTSQMKERSVDDPRFSWFEKSLQSRRVALSANILANDTTLPVVSGARGFKEGDMMYVEHTAEVVRIMADPSSDTALVVQRGVGGSTPTAVLYAGAGVNPNMRGIGSAYEEGSLPPTGVGFDPTEQYNYTQIFRNTLEATRTAIKTRIRTGDDVKEMKREALELHSIDMEMAFWLGRRLSTTHNNKPIKYTGGIFSLLPAGNILDVNSEYSGGMTALGWEEYLYTMFRYGSNEKMVFAGNRALLTLNQMARLNSSFQIGGATKEYGMNIVRFTSPFGELTVKTHPLWNQMQGGTTGGSPYYGMESWLAVLDMDQIGYVYLKDSDTKYQPDLQANGMDGVKSGYLTEAGIEVGNASTHFLLKNLVAAAVD